MDMLLFLLAGVAIGALLGWFIAKASKPKLSAGSSEDYIELDKAFAAYKATSDANLNNIEKSLELQINENSDLNKTLETTQSTLAETKEQLGIMSARYESLEGNLVSEKGKSGKFANDLEDKDAELNKIHRNLAEANADYKGVLELLKTAKEQQEELKRELKTVKDDLNDKNEALATAKADNKALNDKLQTQKNEMEELCKKFNTEFENIANKILETKTEKFTELNKTNLKDILDPLGENLKEFKTKVEEVYDKESKERFSLGEKVKELSLLNQIISEEAKNLTKALKGEAKTQGNWGEMIIESTLERSGLVKDREYFMQLELLH